MYIQLQNFGYNSSVKSMYYDGTYECVERIHQFPEIVVVMGGEVEITVDGKTELARSGDVAVITPFRIGQCTFFYFNVKHLEEVFRYILIA